MKLFLYMLCNVFFHTVLLKCLIQNQKQKYIFTYQNPERVLQQPLKQHKTSTLNLIKNVKQHKTQYSKSNHLCFWPIVLANQERKKRPICKRLNRNSRKLYFLGIHSKGPHIQHKHIINTTLSLSILNNKQKIPIKLNKPTNPLTRKIKQMNVKELTVMERKKQKGLTHVEIEQKRVESVDCDVLWDWDLGLGRVVEGGRELREAESRVFFKKKKKIRFRSDKYIWPDATQTWK